MNAEMSELIEKTKVQEQVNERKKKRKLNEVDQDEAVNTHNSGEAMQKKMKRKFKQNRMIGAEYDDKGNKVNKSLLKSIFTRAGDTDGN